MDLSDTIVPRSDQLNADDLLTGARTFTIEKVTGGSAEQPVNIHLTENPGKPYRPSKSMRRVLVHVWGRESEAYIGQKLTLFRDPTVKFGGIAVGGIVISHMTGLDKPVKISLTVTKGKKSLTTIQPLTESAAEPQVDRIAERLRQVWDDPDGLQKALQYLADNNDPRANDVRERLAELNPAGESEAEHLPFDEATGEVKDAAS